MPHSLESRATQNNIVFGSSTTTHPSYAALKEDYDTMQDTYSGERAVKNASITYLPASRGMILDGYPNRDPGLSAYNDYRDRSVFSSYVHDAVVSYLGSLHLKLPVIEVPSGISGMLAKATASGDTVWALLRQLNTALWGSPMR